MGSKPLEAGISLRRGSGSGQINSSPAMSSLLTPADFVQTTRHFSGRLFKKTSTIWPGWIWPRNRSRTPDSERSIVDASSMRSPMPEPVAKAARVENTTRLPRRKFWSLEGIVSRFKARSFTPSCQVPSTYIRLVLTCRPARGQEAKQTDGKRSEGKYAPHRHGP